MKAYRSIRSCGMMLHLPAALFLPLRAERLAKQAAPRVVTRCCRGAQYLYNEDPSSPRPMLDVVMDKGNEEVLEGLLKVEGTSVNATDDVWLPSPCLP